MMLFSLEKEMMWVLGLSGLGFYKRFQVLGFRCKGLSLGFLGFRVYSMCWVCFCAFAPKREQREGTLELLFIERRLGTRLLLWLRCLRRDATTLAQSLVRGGSLVCATISEGRCKRD